MSNFSIAISGLELAQRALELISTNIANVNTEGYHRQELVSTSVDMGSYGGVPVGGVEIREIRRNIDSLLESQIARQQGSLSQASQELDVLRMVESTFGDVNSFGLGQALSQFFDAMTELTAEPTSLVLRQKVVWAADALAVQFRQVGQSLVSTQEDLSNQAQECVTKTNDLTSEIASLNHQIALELSRGGTPNMLRDRRDQAVQELSRLVDIDVITLADGGIAVFAWGVPVVSGGASVIPLELDLTNDGKLGIVAAGSSYLQTDLTGGRIGGLVSLYNDDVADVLDGLNALANEIITGINRLHVQGVGSTGSFTELAGVEVSADETLDDWSAGITGGSFYVRVTETATGDVARYEIAVDPATDTVEDIAGRLDLIDGLSASVVDSALHINADSGHQFDFLPALSAEPYTSDITGSAAATISGIYTGDANQILTCKVVGSGDVGVAEDLKLQITDEAGDMIEANIGLGYAAGDALDVGYGIKVALSPGELNDGDEFTIQALAQSDTSGFLAAAGMNTLFSGTNCLGIQVRQEILDQPGRLAGAVSASCSDGINVRRMAETGRQAAGALGGVSPVNYFQQLLTNLGQEIVMRDARKTSLENIARQLNVQRDSVSGVDVDQEAAKLIIFERMYQAMSKAIAIQDNMLEALMELV